MIVGVRSVVSLAQYFVSRNTSGVCPRKEAFKRQSTRAVIFSQLCSPNKQQRKNFLSQKLYQNYLSIGMDPPLIFLISFLNAIKLLISTATCDKYFVIPS